MRSNRRRTRNFTGLTFYEEKGASKAQRLAEALQWLAYTVIALFLAIVCFRFFGFRVSVLGGSMEPEIAAGQNVLVNRIAYRMSSAERGDVIAFYPGGDERMHPSIKRIVAIPGDSVQIINGVLLVNGVPSTYSENYSSIQKAGLAEDLLILDDGEYFVMGDNPQESEDSRSASLGMIAEENIIGKVWLTIPI